MNTDAAGLPIQADADAADQLQRVGMLAISNQLMGQSSIQWRVALEGILQPNPGIFRRSSAATTTQDVTGDQLIPVMAFWVLINSSVFSYMRLRLLIAQNWRKQGEPTKRTLPDFMLFRALPIYARNYQLPYILLLAIDILLILASVVYTVTNRKLDQVDDNNLIVTLAVCQAIRPTLCSSLACFVYRKFRATNYGALYYNVHPVLGALRWYHRAEWPSYGNPEIADLWQPVVKKYILPSK